MPHSTDLAADQPPPPSPPLPRRRRRWRLTLLAAMLLVAVVGLGLAVWDDSQRVSVVFANQSDRVVRVVTIQQEGREVQFGPVPPHTTAERRIRPVFTEPIRVAFDVVRVRGKADSHIMAPGVTASGPGGLVRIQYDGQLAEDDAMDAPGGRVRRR